VQALASEVRVEVSDDSIEVSVEERDEVDIVDGCASEVDVKLELVVVGLVDRVELFDENDAEEVSGIIVLEIDSEALLV